MSISASGIHFPKSGKPFPKEVAKAPAWPFPESKLPPTVGLSNATAGNQIPSRARLYDGKHFSKCQSRINC